jgi:thiol:disulfide interchange protein DsbC
MIKPLLAVAVLTVGLVGTSRAEEALIRKGIEAFLGADAKIEGISRPGVLGLHEVRIATRQGIRILYTDSQARYIVRGDVIEAKTKTNITEARVRKLNAIRFDDLPLAQAFKIVRGKGTRPLAYFADPRCPHCKRFDQELAQVDDVTVHVFLMPIVAKDSAAIATAVWCSPDRAKAWQDLMLKDVTPTAPANCDTPIEKNIALSRKYGFSGTPTLVFGNGQHVSGGMPAARLSQLLDEASAR